MAQAAVPAPELRFDTDSHIYRLGPRRLPSVTEVLKATGIVDYSQIPETRLERARQRGSAVHLALDFAHQGVLDPRSVAPEIQGYLWAWDRFLIETGFEPTLVEQPFCDPDLGFAGTPDTYGLLNGEPTLPDVKCTAALQDGFGVQLAAYKKLLVRAGYTVKHRVIVQLKPDGTYRVEPYTDFFDEREFLAALLVYTRNLRRRGELP